MTTVTEKLETAKKWVRSITMPAAITVAAMTTGCMTDGSSKGPQYTGYLNPNDKDFAVQKEAYINQGMAVEATFIPGADGKPIAVYGVREKAWYEKTNDTLGKYAPTIDTVYKAGDLGIKGAGLVYDIKSTHHLEKIRKEEGRQTGAMYQQNASLQNLIQTLNTNQKINCGN